MPILTQDGRIAIAKSLAEQPLHLAWGDGDGLWTTTVPPEDTEATELMNELGRRTVTQVGYVVPDVNGTIELPTGKFSLSATPTNHLYLSTQFEFSDASSSVIREIGVCVGSQMVGGLPVGQTYFAPAQVADPGLLMHVEHFQPIYRSPAIRESFEIVITF